MCRILIVVILLLVMIGCSNSEAEEPTEAPDELLVGTYYYPWWNDRKWQEQDEYPYQPVLGQYDSSDASTVNQHVSWATDHGIDFFAVSWWGPRWEYNNESAGWRDRVIIESLLPALGDLQMCILYETWGRFKKAEDGFRPDTVTDSGKTNQEVLLEDFAYFGETYFDQPSYLKVDGRPVVILALCWEFKDWNSALETLRYEIEQKGYDVYLVGIMDFWEGPDWDAVCVFDAVTCYHLFRPDRLQEHISSSVIDPTGYLQEARARYDVWSQASLGFVPNVMPGFNDTFNPNGAGNPVLHRSVEFFEQLWDLATSYDPEMVMITSFNEWHEGTQVEPGEGYSTSYLQVLQ
ncbi:glycoside hydrolase family 99-like domain-containing protein [Chloroflexota bacterium]